MPFLTPLALLAGLLAIPIILLYMLRLRRREVLVSSTFLWQQIMEDKEANTPWQKLRRNLLLILQLIILLLLVLALMRPFIVVPTLSAGKTALLLDASASMNATDMDGASRFAAAQANALDLISEMSARDVMSVILVGDNAEPLIPYTGDRNALRAAVNNAQPGQGTADWAAALTLAAAGQDGSEQFNIILLSDGGIDDIGLLPRNIPQPTYLPIGSSADNLALTALATRQLSTDSPPQLFAQVVNYSERDISTSLVVRLDGTLWESQTDIIPGELQQSFVFELDEPFTTIEAEIIPDDERADQLALDNTAWAVRTGGGVRRVLWVSAEDNLFLAQVLRSLPALDVVRGNANNARLPEQTFDLYIFDGWLPNILPDSDMLIINPPSSTPLFTLGAAVEGESVGAVRVVRRDDARVAFVDLDNLNLRRYSTINDNGWAQTLIQAGDDPLLLSGETDDGRQIALLPFDLRDSDLPLQIAFPILVSNLVDWFTPADVLNIPAGLRVGDTVTVRPPIGTETITVSLPDGSERSYPADGRALTFTDTHQPGLYTVDLTLENNTTQSQAFAVNLFGLGESDITPVAAGDLILGGGQVNTADDDQLGVRELWSIAALLALLVLLIEWYVYHRRLQVPTVFRPLRRATAR